MLLSGTAHIEETALSFPQYALLHSVTCVQLRLTTILGNCGCVAVARFLGVTSPLMLHINLIVPQSVGFDFQSIRSSCGILTSLYH
jgi:hypothetical protein